MQEDLKKTGYGKEEEYFFRLNRDLIEKRRRQLDAERDAKQLKEGQSAFWMKCPKCGSTMDEVELAGIMVDKCNQCQGIYFDRGELELLLKSQQPASFLDHLRHIFA